MSLNVDVAIIGAGTAGLTAFKQVRQITTNVVLINDGPYGTTCARVGCMPSKVLIEVAKKFARRQHFTQFGIQNSDNLSINRAQVMQYVRNLRDWFVARVMDSVDQIGEKNISGRARFIEPQVLEVNGEKIYAHQVIIATGSRPIVPPDWYSFGDQVITTDQFFELADLPDAIAIIGLGAIGSEIGQSLARLGVKVVGIEQQTQVCGLTDPAVNQIAINEFSQEFDLWLGTFAQLAATESGQIQVTTTDGHSVTVDKVLAALGRRPNIDNLGLEVFGLDLSSGLNQLINPHTMQLGDLPLFVAGDVASLRPILHEVADEGAIAGYNAARATVTAFKRRVPLRIAFTDPQVVIVGATLAELAGQDIVIGERSFVVQGRTKVMARTHGHLRIYADRHSGQLLGAEMMIPDGEYVGHFLALAMEQNLTVQDIMLTPFYHPTVMEGLENALSAIVAQLDGEATGLSLQKV
jgi:dihydrolipoamide dehydrogenase